MPDDNLLPSISLPTHKTPIEMDLARKRILIYGPPKIGKSTFCARAEGAIFLATEPGLGSLETFQLPITSWLELLGSYKTLKAGGHQFKTVIIDTIDSAYKLCVDHYCKKHQVESINDKDLGYGKGRVLVENAIHLLLKHFAELQLGLWLVSHSQDKQVKDLNGSEITRTCPTIPDHVAKIVTGFADMVLYATYQTVKDDNGTFITKRMLRTQGTDYLIAGDRTGRLPIDGLELNYAKFLATYSKNGKDSQ